MKYWECLQIIFKVTFLMLSQKITGIFIFQPLYTQNPFISVLISETGLSCPANLFNSSFDDVVHFMVPLKFWCKHEIHIFFQDAPLQLSTGTDTGAVIIVTEPIVTRATHYAQFTLKYIDSSAYM